MIGEKIREIRIAKGLSQRRLSLLAGFHPNRINKIESGYEKNPSFETVDAIATALGVSVHVFSKDCCKWCSRG